MNDGGENGQKGDCALNEIPQRVSTTNLEPAPFWAESVSVASSECIFRAVVVDAT